jgi:predicted DNA-binding transcriptional regulator YafY
LIKNFNPSQTSENLFADFISTPLFKSITDHLMPELMKPEKNTIHSATYYALERMTYIHRALQRHYDGRSLPPSANELAEKWAVSNKTIQRDIKFMQECWKLPIEYDRSIRGYIYTEAVMEFPGVKLTEDEVFAFLVARNSIQRYQGTNLFEPLANLFDKLVEELQISHSDHIKRVQEYISFKPAGWTRGKYSVLDKLSKACRNRKVISFEYDKPWYGKIVKKEIKPIHLINHDSSWYLVASEENKGEVIYAIARISALRIHATKFREINFSVEKFIKNSFGIFHGSVLHRVKIRFDAFAAPHVKERKWNSSQKITSRKDGGIDFQIVVNDLIEIKGWIMNWGKHAQVLSPASLVNDLKSELLDTLDLYNQ